VSLSVASTVPAAVWFSAASNVAGVVNAGAAFASVYPATVTVTASVGCLESATV
jgi:hypothetical protein